MLSRIRGKRESTSRKPHRDGLQKGRRIGVHVVPPDKQGSMGVQQVEQQDIPGGASCQQVPHVHSLGTCLTIPTSFSSKRPAEMPNNAGVMHMSHKPIDLASVDSISPATDVRHGEMCIPDCCSRALQITW